MTETEWNTRGGTTNSTWLDRALRKVSHVRVHERVRTRMAEEPRRVYVLRRLAWHVFMPVFPRVVVVQ